MTEIHIQCPQLFDQAYGRELFTGLRERGIESGVSVVLDFGSTDRMDTRGGAWLIEIANYVQSLGGKLNCIGHHDQVSEFLQLLGPGFSSVNDLPVSRAGLLEQLGEASFSVLSEVKQFNTFLVDTLYWTLIGPFEGHRFRWVFFIDELHEMGVRALKITCLMNFLLGIIVAMLAAAQLELFGASIYVADLVVVAFSRELAAVMTAVVVSARTGAATSAELATMKVQEELDALRGMGFHVGQFLVAPKLLALTVVLPLLTGLGMIAGIGGGMVWGILVLDFQIDIWLSQSLNAASFSDIFQGFFKSIFFAIGIILIGCHNGLRVSGGARGVGLMTTRAVVMDIFFIIVIDMIFAAIFYYIL